MGLGLGGFLAITSVLFPFIIGCDRLVYRNIKGDSIIHIVVVGTILFFIISADEELMFRGYLFKKLKTKVGFWSTAIITSILFSLYHIPVFHENFMALVFTFGFGVLLSCGLRLTQSMWWTIGFHSAYDYFASFSSENIDVPTIF